MNTTSDMNPTGNDIFSTALEVARNNATPLAYHECVALKGIQLETKALGKTVEELAGIADDANVNGNYSGQLTWSMIAISGRLGILHDELRTARVTGRANLHALALAAETIIGNLAALSAGGYTETDPERELADRMNLRARITAAVTGTEEEIGRHLRRLSNAHHVAA